SNSNRTLGVLADTDHSRIVILDVLRRTAVLSITDGIPVIATLVRVGSSIQLSHHPGTTWRPFHRCPPRLTRPRAIERVGHAAAAPSTAVTPVCGPGWSTGSPG